MGFRYGNLINPWDEEISIPDTEGPFENPIFLLHTINKIIQHFSSPVFAFLGPFFAFKRPPILWDIKAMNKGKIEAMTTKFSEKFVISMLKKHRNFCRRGLTHLDATPIVQIHMRHPVGIKHCSGSH